MIIDINKHYFHYYANQSEVNKLNNFHVGEIVTDWNGKIGCILVIYKNGEVRTDSNGMGDISQLKKVRNIDKITDYLTALHKADISNIESNFKYELSNLTTNIKK